MLLVTMLCCIQIILIMTPLGFIPIGLINITTLHIPTILAGVLLGSKAGAILGLTFGLGSFIRATVMPGPMSFLFSPFAPPLGDYYGNVWSLVIVFVPRILLGVVSALIYRGLKNKSLTVVSSTITAILSTIFHTVAVVSLIYIFFGSPYTEAIGQSGASLLTVLMAIFMTNGLLEVVLAAAIIPALVKVLEPMTKR